MHARAFWKSADKPVVCLLGISLIASISIINIRAEDVLGPTGSDSLSTTLLVPIEPDACKRDPAPAYCTPQPP